MSNAVNPDIYSENESLRARVAELESQLLETPQSISSCFPFTPALIATLGLLLREEVIDVETFEADDHTPKNIKVTIHRLRKMLAPYKIDVRSRRSTGYWIADADKDRIRQMITDAVTTASGAV